MVERYEETTVLAAGGPARDHSYVDWPAIIVGAVVATAASFVLHSFGAAIGLSVVSPYGAEEIGLGLLIGAALWMMWVTISCFMLGAYIAGRLRRRAFDATEHEVDIRDGSHGLAVWAVGIVFSVLVAAAGADTAVRAGAQAIAAGAAASSEAGSGLAGQLADEADFRNGLNRLFRPEAEGSLRSDPAAAMRREALAGDYTTILAASGEEVAIDPADRSYMVASLAAEAGLTPEQAESRVDGLIATWRELQQQALEAADRARKASIVAAFVLAATLLIAAAGAWWAASMGGDHRDRQTVFRLLGRRR